ncbi:hypothetical protein IFR05_010097 [Cadophora sp. M221]|nr:hypothetical protein IFR05_010097 [Cadophora sp. M221]
MRNIIETFKRIFSLGSFDLNHDGRRDVSETEESHGRIQRYLPHIATKTVNQRSTSRSDTSNTTMIGSPDDLTTSQTVDDDSTDNENHNATIKNPERLLSPSPSGNIPSMHNLQMIGTDQESRKSFSSDVANKYQKYVRLVDSDGIYFNVLVQFDTGASSSFISRGTLARLGTHKENDIPEKSAHTYSSPVDPNASTKPIRYIEVQMANEELAFFDQTVRLKIMEVPSVFQIIIGRNKMHQHCQHGLMARLERSESDIMDDEDSPRIIFPVFKAPRTKSEQAIADARDNQTRDKKKQAFLERQETLQGSSYGFTDAARAGREYWNGPSPAPPNASADTPNQQPAPFCQYYSQTTNIGYAGQPDHSPQMGVNRSYTGASVSTQSTQHTQYSMEAQSFASSATSCSHDSSVGLLPWKATGPQPLQDESTQYAGHEDSPRRM